MSATALLTTTSHPAPPVRHLSLTGAAAPIAPVHHATRSIVSGLPARLNRYLGGLCSPTIQMIQLTDGRRARTDLVRLNPTVDAYSLDLDGIAPTPVSHYRPSRQSDTGTRPADPALARILAGSFPLVTLPELSRRVRAAGYPLAKGGPARARGDRRDPSGTLALHQRGGPRRASPQHPGAAVHRVQ